MVITGAGSAFCAGADLVTRFEPTEAGADGPVDTFRPAFEELLDAIVDHPAPVIAAVNGPAMGAGHATRGRVRPARRRARPRGSRFRSGALGVHLSPRNIWRLAMLVGQGAARDFLLAGRSVDAEEARRLGIVQRLADDASSAALAIAADDRGVGSALGSRSQAVAQPRGRGAVAVGRRAGRGRRARSRRVRERRSARGHGRVRREAHAQLQGK